MSVPNPPAYRVAWRAAKYGTRSHAVITDVHPLVRTAWLDDDGGPFDDADLERTLATHTAGLARPERKSDRRCEGVCAFILGELDYEANRAARLWAIEQLRGVLDELAQSAPIAPPEHGR